MGRAVTVTAQTGTRTRNKDKSSVGLAMHAPHQVPQGAVDWALVAGGSREEEVDVLETEELAAVAVGQGGQGRRALRGLQSPDML